jgi:hypothetical protein
VTTGRKQFSKMVNCSSNWKKTQARGLKADSRGVRKWVGGRLEPKKNDHTRTQPLGTLSIVSPSLNCLFLLSLWQWHGLQASVTHCGLPPLPIIAFIYFSRWQTSTQTSRFRIASLQEPFMSLGLWGSNPLCMSQKEKPAGNGSTER